ncbi:DUF934 domain-containing protein [Marinimicrobium sp. LS-A18]|uniref:DUF934 domain-containing protein n=1 Tax=Marinimicrobium sp. LS-A18 TaxID=1381596 RepID=UPI000464584D|nr:DUF934 domain-containing protein [Marinimicrobium sp. LS-A18]
MPKLVKDGAIVDNEWTLMAKPEGEAAEAEVPAGQIIVPLSVWLAQKEALSARKDIGVWIDTDETADQLGEEAQRFPLVAVHFPAFADGRAFTNARLLRERFGFTGELRAVGYFLAEQACYLRRCGVNAFDFGTDREQHLQATIEALNDFTEYYQASVDQPQPLFRRRAS